jgi:hypothetical protein
MHGISTIGNATLIVHDGQPLLATDPWYGHEDAAYFGSWRLTHTIPAEQREQIEQAEFVWFSHAHPDHLNPESVKRFRNQKILLPDHHGRRVADDLIQQGYTVKVLEDRTWHRLSDRVRVMTICDFYQDAALIIEMGEVLFLNANDCGLKDARSFIRALTRKYKKVYLLKLQGHGDATMINLFDEDGRRIPRPAPKPIGRELSSEALALGATHVVPFSTFHMYQRDDSVWANAHIVRADEFSKGFDNSSVSLLPAFSTIDPAADRCTEIRPEALPDSVISAQEFGDNWSDLLEASEPEEVRRYFQEKRRLAQLFGFIKVRIGGQETTVDLQGPTDVGITFEAPRSSFMAAIRYEIFDDLLAGNFMRTTLHAVPSLNWPHHRYNFKALVGKIADNGRSKSERQVRDYLAHYRWRAGLEWVLTDFERATMRVAQRHMGSESSLYRGLRKVKRLLRSA